ncbi:MAG: hypothetical protein GXO89_14355 [Chlorobi bacterium]|nr:hypothetical protein [Chlorobiota bacterium]
MKHKTTHRNKAKPNFLLLVTILLSFQMTIVAQESKKQKRGKEYEIDNKVYQKISNSLLKLSDIQLREIGFIINDDSVFFDSKYSEKGKIRHISFCNDKGFCGINLSSGKRNKSSKRKLSDYIPIAILQGKTPIFDINLEEGGSEVVPVFLKANPNLQYPGDMIILLFATPTLKKKLSGMVDNPQKYLMNY